MHLQNQYAANPFYFQSGNPPAKERMNPSYQKNINQNQNSLLSAQSSPFSLLEEKFDKVSFENEQKSVQLRNSITALANKLQNGQKGKKQKTHVEDVEEEVEAEEKKEKEKKDEESYKFTERKTSQRVTTRLPKKKEEKS